MNSKLNPQTSGIRLVIADVDGTLVTQEKVLTPRATAAVKKLHDAGILFGITSGRPPKGMRMLIEPLQLTEPLAGFNGGVVVNTDLVTLSEHLLPADVAAEAVKLIVDPDWTFSFTQTRTGLCAMPTDPTLHGKRRQSSFHPRSFMISIR